MALSQQMSLRLSDRHRELIRVSDEPEKVTEADAARALIEEAGRARPQDDAEVTA